MNYAEILLYSFWISGGCMAFSEGWTTVFEKSLKPFSCPSCLSLWVGVIATMLTQCIFLLFIPFVLTKIIMKFLWS